TIDIANTKTIDEEALQIAASGGTIDLERWKGMAEPLIERLEYLQIVYNVFPMPQVRSEHIDQPTFPNHPPQENTAQSGNSNKENSSSNPMSPPPIPSSSLSSERVPDSQPQPSGSSADSQLPRPLASLLSAIRSSIESSFKEKPPHTIQRLAELILYPTKHYRTLPAYLRAVDRVVSVTSSADIFPFKTPAASDILSNGQMHPGINAGAYVTPDYAHCFGSDESLGGALLTPIPWLMNVPFDGDDANGDTDVLGEGTGENLPLQSQEQSGLAIQPLPETEEGLSTASPEPSDEAPHARGPIRLGVEDMGLQDGKGVEMDLGADGVNDVPAAVAAAAEVEEEEKKEHSTPSKDGDIVLEEDKPKEGEEAKNETTPTEAGAGSAESESTSDLSHAPDAGANA
ncbi:Protein phosphatase 4 core regulatory subunit R2, partial [Penicillium sp. DV-2018c]